MLLCHFASSNLHKLKELRDIFSNLKAQILLLSAKECFGSMLKVDENADSFEGNARLKALALAEKIPVGELVLADDSGLEVNALGGHPGIKSARYAGDNASDQQNNAKLLHELSTVFTSDRKARFQCCFVLHRISSKGQSSKVLDQYFKESDELVFKGTCRGKIALKASGNQGFGYDSLFIPEGYKKTLAELGEGIKSKISHRAKAVESMVAHFEDFKCLSV